MRTPRLDRIGFLGTLALLGLAALSGASGVWAQEPGTAEGEAGPPGPPQEATELVFEREIFQYPDFQRRNPFKSLVGTGSGPRFEAMSLQGIIFSAEDPGQSMALMRAGGGGETAAVSRRLRVGQRWGNVRIIDIRRTEVLVEVEEFGIMEQRIMELPTRGQGGS